MNFKEIQELIKLVAKAELAEVKIKEGDFLIHLRGKGDTVGNTYVTTAAPAPAYAPVPAPSSAPVAAAAAPSAVPDFAPTASAAPAAADTNGGNYLEIKSPMIGTFYRASSPDKGPYVKVGDKVQSGSTVCVIEAMKLFNEIESEVSGKIVKVLVEDAQPVEYDQVLFLVEPGA